MITSLPVNPAAATTPRLATPTQQPGTNAFAAASKSAEAETAADQFIGTALIAPLLELAADDPLKSDLFGSGFAQDAFKQQLRQTYTDTLADRLDLHRSLDLRR